MEFRIINRRKPDKGLGDSWGREREWRENNIARINYTGDKGTILDRIEGKTDITLKTLDRY